MDPVTAIALAKGIASATGLSDWLSNKLGDALGDKTAKKITDIAQAVTGAGSAGDALKQIQENAKARDAVKLKILDQEHELVLAQLEDVKNARELYATKNAMADMVANQVIKQNHLAVLLLLMANGLVLYYVEDKTLALALGNLIGTSVGALWHERQQVIGFFFGSSLGSKLKTALSVQKDG